MIAVETFALRCGTLYYTFALRCGILYYTFALRCGTLYQPACLHACMYSSQHACMPDVMYSSQHACIQLPCLLPVVNQHVHQCYTFLLTVYRDAQLRACSVHGRVGHDTALVWKEGKQCRCPAVGFARATLGLILVKRVPLAIPPEDRIPATYTVDQLQKQFILNISIDASIDPAC